MTLKQGVKGTPVPELQRALEVAERIYNERGYQMTVTSLNDGKHKPGSLHYQDRAADLRIYNLGSRSKAVAIVAALKAALPGFDVVLEADHIHMEWDPR